MLDLTLSLPTFNSEWKAAAAFTIYKKLSDVETKVVSTSGACYHRLYREKRRHHLLAEGDEISAENSCTDSSDSDASDDEEQDLHLDPREWKSQDHYAVLGLSRLRWKSTEEDIKKAFRKQVLKHHPDKKAAAGETDDSYFKCVQKAYEILIDPIKRKQFDSVDENADWSIPSSKNVKDDEFFQVYGAIFERESRFSNIQPVPKLGDMSSTKSEVETFYDFWYSFDSWKSFEYLDKEVAETESRDEKRYHEKNNKNERARRKKEDNARLRKLIDMVLKRDVRIALFKKQEKSHREAARIAKEEEAKKAKEDAVRKAEEEKIAKEKVLAEEKENAAKAKKLKEFKKQQLRKEKKNLKNFCNAQNYFEVEKATISAMEAVLARLEQYFAVIDEPQDLQSFLALMEKCFQEGKDEKEMKSAARIIFEEQIESAIQAKAQQGSAPQTVGK